jgi:hypothetical protein
MDRIRKAFELDFSYTFFCICLTVCSSGKTWAEDSALNSFLEFKADQVKDARQPVSSKSGKAKKQSAQKSRANSSFQEVKLNQSISHEAREVASSQPEPVTNRADKSGHHLFNPTPRQLMRDFATDRPDKTESPYTVDAGHFQIETDLVAYTRDRSKSGTEETSTSGYAFNLINLKAGLTNSIDLQALVETYNTQNSTINGETSKLSGFGDLTIRLKQNVLGNDEGDLALALMPFVKVPTNSGGLGNDSLEGGLIFPVGVALPGDWSMCMMLQYNVARNEGDGYHGEWISSVTFSHDIIGNLAAYGELFSLSSSEAGSNWVATYDMGLTLEVVPNVQLDLGANLGITEAADDVNPFLGVSVRL